MPKSTAPSTPLKDDASVADTARACRPTPLRVLLVADDAETVRLIDPPFSDQGVFLTHALDGGAALTALRERTGDVVLLDALLPGPGGLELCRQIREQSDVPVILLSARTAEEDRLLGFEAGADDYVCKPFSPRELLYRVVALVRRARGQVGPARHAIQVGELVLEPGSLRAMRNGRDLGLTSYEFHILYALVLRRGRACSREQLIDAAGGSAENGFERSIDVHVSRVRQKLGDHARQPQLLKTVRGTGYLFARPTLEE